MGLLSRRRARQEVDLEERAPQTGLKFKDMLVLEALVRAGADVHAPRHVLYYLYFEHPDRAAAAATDAAGLGFDTEIREPTAGTSDSWTLVCERHDYMLTLDAVRENTDSFEEIAARHEGDFDGWEASVC
jgi:regulator of RNase E activity RraB